MKEFSQDQGLEALERERYARHFSLEEVGVEGQQKLKKAKVLCIGAGGLGSPAALYLAAAGVGSLGIVDPDRVELSNLQRQLLHGESDLGRLKVASAVDRLAEVNPHVEVVTYEERLTAQNARRVAEGYDLIIDGSDNFPTRYLVNDLGFFLKIPTVYGAIQQFTGQLSVFAPHLGGPCYRCMFPEPPAPGKVPSCAEAGVLGVLPGIIGSMQAMEAIKLILGIGSAPLGRMLHYDALQTSFREFQLKKDPDCPLCGNEPSVTELVDYDRFCGLPNRDMMDSITADELHGLLADKPDTNVVDVRTPEEWEEGHLPSSQHIPMQDIPARLEELPEERPLYFHCKVGGRSARVVEYLKGLGYEGLVNVEGQVVK